MTDVLQLQEIHVKLSSPHEDVPVGSKILAQIIIEDNVFAQTVPTEPTDEEGVIWKLDVNRIIPSSVSRFDIAILRKGSPNTTRLLGITEVATGEVLAQAKEGFIEISLPLINVNNDAPLTVVKTAFSTNGANSPAARVKDSKKSSEIQHTNECHLNLPAETMVAELHQSMTSNHSQRAVGVYSSGEVQKAENHFNLDVTYWSDLGVCLRRRFEQLGDTFALNRSIQLFQQALALTPDDDSDKPSRLSNLGTSLLSRFQHLLDLSDLSRSILAFEQALALTPDGHHDKPSQFSNLGMSLHYRFEHLGDLFDLDRSIQAKEQALSLIPDEHSHRASHLNNLGISLLSRFEQLGDLSDLNRSVQVKEQALALTPDSHFDKPTQLNNLGNSLLSRFERLGDPSDLNKSVQAMEYALALTPDGHPDKPSRLNNLANSLLSQFDQLGDLSDLNRSIQIFEQVLALTPDGHSYRPSRLNSLGISFLSRFEQLGDLSDLSRSIQVKEQALALTPDGHSQKPFHLNSLGNSLLSRFEQLEDLSDLNRSIQVFEQAVALTPDEHSSKSSRLSNLGNCLYSRFELLRDLPDLNRSIQIFEHSLALTPDGYSDKSSRLKNLGISLHSRFQQLGDLSDLSRSIQVKEQALALTPDGHSGKPSQLNSLSNSLHSQFEQLGNLPDLNRSIQLKEQALALTSDGHSDKPSRFSTLGISLLSRFEQLGDLSDLKRSIQVFEQALALTPDGHPNKASRLHNLGIPLHSSFEKLGDLSDLNRSIQVFEEALALTPKGQSHRPSRLNDLGNSLHSRFERLRDQSDLNRSIQLFEQAIALTPDGHPDKSFQLSNLGISLLSRYEQLGDLSDLNRSIEVKEKALALTPDGHSDKASQLNNLGNSLISEFQHSTNSKSLSSALSNFALAANSISGPSSVKFQAATVWMSYAQTHTFDQAMEPCHVAMTLIPQLLPLGASITDWHHQIKSVGSAARDAAGVAITKKQYNIALEWLEQGRSIVWNQLLQLRSPLDRLQEVYPHLASDFQFLSLQLEGSTTHFTGSDNQLNSSIQKDYHELAQRRQTLLQDIRQKPGFERFLQHKTVSELLPAAERAPIVVLNFSESRVDALALHQELGVLHIPLPDVVSTESYDRRSHGDRSVESISNMLERLESEDVVSMSCREHPVLATIWYLIVGPILNILNITTPMSPGQSVRRIWWCPTGPLTSLPIHAAGIYPNGPKLSEYVVSSYTPTISALLDANRTRSVIPSRLLIVSLPNEANLPGTRKEVNCIVNHAQNISIRNLCEDAAIPRSVSEEMVESEWAHFACHGMQDPKNPTQSSLRLAKNSRLSLSDILKLRLEKAQFAFLSACQTATGDRKLEDEAVHLAAGMLLAGYRGVIATTRSVNDEYAAEIADDTYRRLFNDYGGDFTRAAEALHFAIQKVRGDREAKGDFSFAWVPFIHMGA